VGGGLRTTIFGAGFFGSSALSFSASSATIFSSGCSSTFFWFFSAEDFFSAFFVSVDFFVSGALLASFAADADAAAGSISFATETDLRPFEMLARFLVPQNQIEN